MPVPYHHFYLADLRRAASASGLQPEYEANLRVLMDAAERMRQEYEAAFAQVQQSANDFLTRHYDRLRPSLRPCHQKRFDSGARVVEINQGFPGG
jgi:hypothetical protein